jgi:two-component system sensor histidine kinase/response regulator
VSSGRAAIAAAARDRYDVILIDCHMPEVDGFLATRAIRAAERRGHRTPIVAVTASALVEDREECRAAGMDDCLVKPVTTGALERALRESLRAKTDGDGRHLDLEVLDRLATDLGGEDELRRIVTIFVDGLPRAQRELRAAIEDDCPFELERSAHKLTSSSANFGAARLAELAGRVEQIARSATTRGTAERLAELDAEAAAVTGALRTWLAAQGGVSSSL